MLQCLLAIVIAHAVCIARDDVFCMNYAFDLLSMFQCMSSLVVVCVYTFVVYSNSLYNSCAGSLLQSMAVMAVHEVSSKGQFLWICRPMIKLLIGIRNCVADCYYWFMAIYILFCFCQSTFKLINLVT